MCKNFYSTVKRLMKASTYQGTEHNQWPHLVVSSTTTGSLAGGATFPLRQLSNDRSVASWLITMVSIYNNRIVKIVSPRAWLTWTDGRRAGEVGTGGERRQAAGQNRGLGQRRASQNRDVTPEAWLARTNGRAGGYRQSRRRAAWRLVQSNTAVHSTF